MTGCFAPKKPPSLTPQPGHRNIVCIRLPVGRRVGVVLFRMEKMLPTDELRPGSEADEMGLRDVGFRWGDKGTHTSRTIMLDELRAVLASCEPDATRDDYLAAI